MAKQPAKSAKKKEEQIETVSEVPEVTEEATPEPTGRGGKLAMPVLAVGLFLCGAGTAALLGPKVLPNYFGADLSEVRAEMAQSNQTLLDKIDALEAARSDSADPSLAIDELRNEIEARLSALAATAFEDATDWTPQIDALDAKLSNLEGTFSSLREELLTASSENGEVSTEAVQLEIAALRTELANTKSANAELQSAISSLEADVSRQLETAADSVANLGVVNTEAITEADRKRAIAQLGLALQSGYSFADELAVAQSFGVAVSPALQNAQAGIATLPELIERFEILAHEAIRASAQNGNDGSVVSRVQSFFQSQISVRALEAQEGDDTNAILSRMNAALRIASLDDVLAEAGGLDESAARVFADWLMQVSNRRDALAAFQQLQE